jgi:hypothetical protein
MPLVSWSRPSPTELLGVGCAELPTPEADGLVADLDPALGEQLLDITLAQVEPVVEPDGVADDLGGEPMATVQGGIDGHRPILPKHALRNLSTPEPQCFGARPHHSGLTAANQPSVFLHM